MIAFWIAALGIGLPVYSYAIYPVLLFLMAAVVQTGRDAAYLLSRRDRRRRGGPEPVVSIIIAAHNEEESIGRTLQALLKLEYPRDRLEIIIGSDASTDRTNEIVGARQRDGITLVPFTSRRGKLAVISDCAALAKGDILVFSDANTTIRPDALRMLARHFRNPGVGGVCGELRLISPEGSEVDEGLYWRFEQILKMLESRLDSTLGSNGALYAVRRELFRPLPAGMITEDFIIPMKTRERGFRVLYDPEAVATEEAPAKPEDEFRRRIRIGAGNWQALWYCWRSLLPWRGFVAFAYFSHKVLRWLTPFIWPIGFAANCFLLDFAFWRWALAAQGAFCALAMIGGVMSRLKLPSGPLRTVWYFALLNAAIGLGMARGALGLQRAAWRRTARDSSGVEVHP